MDQDQRSAIQLRQGQASGNGAAAAARDHGAT